MSQSLELFQLAPDSPFVMHCDASDKAIGAVLERHRVIEGETKLVPEAFFCRKLGKNQLNWTIREKGTYAIATRSESTRGG